MSEPASADETHRASWEPRVLKEALEAVVGERNRHYGHPWDNHQRTADMWRAYLRGRFGVDLDLLDRDVCALNALQKLSRLANNVNHWDSWTDIAGYAANGGACIDHESAGGS